MKSNGVMPISPRQKDGKDRNPRSLEDEYVVFLQGIPPQCRWQELKDFVRQTALHIRQAVVYDDCHGHPTGLGQIIVKNEDEAWRTYNRLSTNGWNGHSLTVTLSLASEPTKPIAGPTKSPSLSGMPYASGFSVPPVTSAPMGASPACVPNQDMPASPTFTQPPDHQHPPFMAPLPGACHPPYVQFPDSVGYHVPLVFPGENAFFVPHPAFYPPSFDSYQFGQPRYMTNNCIQAYPGFFPHRHSLSGPSVGVASGMNHDSVPGGTASRSKYMPPPTMATTPGTPTKEAQQSATESPSPSLVAVTPTSTADEAETKSEKSSSSSSRKNSTEPLVVNGSCVGTKSPVTGIEKDELSQRTLALHL
ncbi:hypothetical protein TEQG_04388 [Trichophyton equinum CBS 127.97]|uniref:RRM domain-containing protein n=1 Tax=Trichophyton equinum (strain ATCC MYA-4606 / CBS 127.97) TaxID=559882 RepID=F2PTL3_TRIEC|nr:hypothetical protein TEQG_04388 [Trichophyton equinum CBS 127.97]